MTGQEKRMFSFRSPLLMLLCCRYKWLVTCRDFCSKTFASCGWRPWRLSRNFGSCCYTWKLICFLFNFLGFENFVWTLRVSCAVFVEMTTRWWFFSPLLSFVPRFESHAWIGAASRREPAAAAYVSGVEEARPPVDLFETGTRRRTQRLHPGTRRRWVRRSSRPASHFGYVFLLLNIDWTLPDGLSLFGNILYNVFKNIYRVGTVWRC